MRPLVSRAAPPLVPSWSTRAFFTFFVSELPRPPSLFLSTIWVPFQRACGDNRHSPCLFAQFWGRGRAREALIRSSYYDILCNSRPILHNPILPLLVATTLLWRWREWASRTAWRTYGACRGRGTGTRKWEQQQQQALSRDC